MIRKEYIIGNTKFYLKEYGELTGLEEEKINSILFAGGTQENIEINISGYEIFPLILVPEGQQCDIKNYEWKNLKNRQIAEILVDFIVEKKTSQDSMLNYMKELTGQKLLQSGSMNGNTVNAGHTEEINPSAL